MYFNEDHFLFFICFIYLREIIQLFTYKCYNYLIKSNGILGFDCGKVLDLFSPRP